MKRLSCHLIIIIYFWIRFSHSEAIIYDFPFTTNPQYSWLFYIRRIIFPILMKVLLKEYHEHTHGLTLSVGFVWPVLAQVSPECYSIFFSVRYRLISRRYMLHHNTASILLRRQLFFYRFPLKNLSFKIVRVCPFKITKLFLISRWLEYCWGKNHGPFPNSILSSDICYDFFSNSFVR